jgi:hypothetical protein
MWCPVKSFIVSCHNKGTTWPEVGIDGQKKKSRYIYDNFCIPLRLHRSKLNVEYS